MKYEIRYYMHNDKTRFFETELGFNPEKANLGSALALWLEANPFSTIQKIVKLPN